MNACKIAHHPGADMFPDPGAVIGVDDYIHRAGIGQFVPAG